MDGRTCARCGTHYPPHLVEVAFRRRGSARDASRAHICRPCEKTAADAKKIANRWPTKAYDLIKSHAKRFGMPEEELISRCGWDRARIAHDGEHNYRNGCSYCGRSYASMGHGLADITLDIIDRSQPPYYRTNTKWCCQSCNRKKSARTPEFFEQDRQVYELWEATQALAADQRGMLF